jgi:uncharacterized membrane protein YeaQ/YmgE (transglycosylase-associated protein family)
MEGATGVGLGFGILILLIGLSGLLTGALARWLLPGPDPMSWLATVGYGIAGSFLGGIVAQLLKLPATLNFVLAVAGAAALIWFFRRRKTGA